MKSSVEGDFSFITLVCTSVPFFFFLLECIVNNLRNKDKGTWMRRERRPTGTEDELVAHLIQCNVFSGNTRRV